MAAAVAAAALGGGYWLARSPSVDSAKGDAPAVDLSPLAAPEGLLATAVVAKPGTTWPNLRSALGGGTLIIPQRFGGAVATLVGLPLETAVEIDGDVPAYAAFAMVKRGAGEARLGFALAVHVKAGDRVVDQAQKLFYTKLDAATGVTILQPKRAGTQEFGLGVVGNYLLVASTPSDLLYVGPYAARTLPTLPARGEAGDVVIDLPGDALRGSGGDLLRAELAAARKETGDDALPFATLDALVDASRDLEGAVLTAALDQRGVHVHARLAPKPGGGPATKLGEAMRVGDPTKALFVPQGSAIGGVVFEHAEERTKSALRFASELEEKAGALPEATRAELEAALRAIGEARGEATLFAMHLDEGVFGATARAQIDDAAKADGALDALVRLAKRPDVAAALADADFTLTATRTKATSLGELHRVKLVKHEPKRRAEPGADGGEAREKKKRGDANRARPGKTSVLPEPPPLPSSEFWVARPSAETVLVSVGTSDGEPLRLLFAFEGRTPPAWLVPRAVKAPAAASDANGDDEDAKAPAPKALPDEPFANAIAALPEAETLRAGVASLGPHASFAIVADARTVVRLDPNVDAATKAATRSGPPSVVWLAVGRGGPSAPNGELWVHVDASAPAVTLLGKRGGRL